MSISKVEIAGFLAGLLIAVVVGVYVMDSWLSSIPSDLDESKLYPSSQVVQSWYWSSDPLPVKVIVIVSLAGLTFYLMTKAGLIPSFSSGEDKVK